MNENADVIIQLAAPLLLLVAAYFIGNAIERRHFQSLLAREKASRKFLTATFPVVPGGQEVEGAQMLTGSVVISVDYFKRFIAGLKQIFGGRITTYEPLLDRARREALMRLRETAHRQGFHAVVNVRLETSRLASSRGNNEGTAAVEMLAFGTALRFRRDAAGGGPTPSR